MVLVATGAAIAALAEVGATHPDRLWLRLAVGATGASVLLVVVGWLGERLVHRVPVTEHHAATLRGSVSTLVASLNRSRACEYGDGHKPRDAFRAHYKLVGARLDDWDSLIQALDAAVDALRRCTTEQATASALPGEDVDQIAASVFRSCLDRACRGRLDDGFHLDWTGVPEIGAIAPRGQQRAWIVLPADAGESNEAWTARARERTDKVDAFGQVAQSWPEATALAERNREFDRFRREELPGLLDALRLVEARMPPAEVSACPTCRE